MLNSDIATIIALATAALTLPPAVVAVQEYRKRPNIRPSIELRDGIKISIVNYGTSEISDHEIDIALRDTSKELWHYHMHLTYLAPGQFTSVIDQNLRLIDPDRLSERVTLSLRLWPSRPRKLSASSFLHRQRTWHILDPAISTEMSSGIKEIE